MTYYDGMLILRPIIVLSTCFGTYLLCSACSPSLSGHLKLLRFFHYFPGKRFSYWFLLRYLLLSCKRNHLGIASCKTFSDVFFICYQYVFTMYSIIILWHSIVILMVSLHNV